MAPPPAVLPDRTLNDLKRELDDPVAYFLGEEFASVVMPGGSGEYYGFPPGKEYVFRDPGLLRTEELDSRLCSPLPRAVWQRRGTGGCYPFTDGDLADYPISYADMEGAYARVAERVGIQRHRGRSPTVLSCSRWSLAPLDLDEHSRVLLDAYEKRKDWLHAHLRCVMGRGARVATLTVDRPGRQACSYSGRCLWGCPHGGLLYTVTDLEAPAGERAVSLRKRRSGGALRIWRR